MQLKHEFIRTCNQLGLEDGELSLAEVIWQKAERAAWGLSQQIPSLLDNKAEQYKQIKLEIDMIEPDFSTSDHHKDEELYNALTQSDVQMLTKLIAAQINSCQSHIDYNKVTIHALWKLCYPDDPETKEAFDTLNLYKQRTAKYKQKRDKLAKLQYKLKKLQALLGE